MQIQLGGHSSRYFPQSALALASRLPRRRYLINLCEDRRRFIDGLIACALRNCICLLPPSRSPETLARLGARYLNHAVLNDADLYPKSPFPHLFHPTRPANLWLCNLRVICFTSGSSGNPTPWFKDGRALLSGARLALKALGWQRKRWSVVATTPTQHMFALETAVIWPLCSQLSPTSRRPFYPEDIRRALAEAPHPALLVSTPIHLRACLDSAYRWRNLAAILSATAPLDLELARNMEAVTGRPVLELYGSTETQSFAWRRPALSPYWRLYPGVELECKEEGILVHAPWLPASVVLGDRFEPSGDGRFRALGRNRELIKVAGKRISLGELNHHLTNLPGVEDGCFFSTGHERVGALVVSPLSRNEILTHLRQRIDAVFLPRPLIFVDRIPRNAAGKLIHSRLQALLNKQCY